MPWPKQASKITFAQSKRRTLQSIIYSPEKKNDGLEQEAFWHEKLCRRASKSCPDASVEIALTFSLRITRSLRSRRLEVVGTRKNGLTRRRHALRVSLARARSLFRLLLPSACYAGYITRDIPSRSNSKTLASTAELKFEFKSAISEFRIIFSRSFISFLTRGLFVLWGGWGEIKRERARGTMVRIAPRTLSIVFD